jgi:hypothetical protein
MGIGAGAAAVVTSRCNRDDHQRSVPTLIPSRAANTAAVSPLALHFATRFCHVTLAAFAIGSHRAVSRAIAPERCSCSGYHNGARVRQTSEIGPDLTALLAKLGVPLPPKLHAVAAVPAVIAPSSAA